MKSFLAHYSHLVLVGVVVLLAGCKQPETVVVDENPTVSAPDTADQARGNEASFRKLVVGEYNTISSLDPLFANSAAAMRAVQLVYEGLVRLDANGSVMPGMAKSWEASNDSLKYTFRLRPEVYYHDSDVFSTGTGRKLASDDVKFVFERMASAGVPPKGAQLFMDIEGFDPYFHEQHEVYLPSDRKLDGISGITTPNDSTVVFELIEKDPNFLKKLATPLAVVYPRQAVAQNVESFTPVGTGPFTFSSRTNDSTLVFSKFQNYYAASDIKLNRVDIVSNSSESQLFRAMGAGDILVMPQLGPQLMQNIVDSAGVLNPSYAQRYNLQTTNGTTEFTLRFNPHANLSDSNAQFVSRVAATESRSYFNQFPDRWVVSQSLTDTTTNLNSSGINDQLYSVYAEDPFVRTYLGTLSKALGQYDVNLQMMDIRAPSRNTGLFFTTNYPLIPDLQWDGYPELFQLRVKQAALMRSEIKALDFNRYPWWFDVRSVTLPAIENLN